MTDTTQLELRMLANRMLTQTEARNGYQGSPVCLLLRKDAEKAMALMTKAADLVDVLKSSLRLQAEVAADANAQLRLLRGLIREYMVNDGSEGGFDALELSRVRREIYQAMSVEPPSKPATLPLEIAGSLLPDDYVSPRLAAEAHMENEPAFEVCGVSAKDAFIGVDTHGNYIGVRLVTPDEADGKCVDDGGVCGIGGYCEKCPHTKHERDAQQQKEGKP